MTSARWAGNVTFGFTTSASQYSASYGSGETTKGFQALSSNQAAAARDAISSWAELTNLKITETSGGTADIKIAASSLPATAWAYTPGSSAEAGDVWMGTSKNYFSNPVDGNYAKLTFIHELATRLASTIRISRLSVQVAAVMSQMTVLAMQSALAAAA